MDLFPNPPRFRKQLPSTGNNGPYILVRLLLVVMILLFPGGCLGLKARPAASAGLNPSPDGAIRLVGDDDVDSIRLLKPRNTILRVSSRVGLAYLAVVAGYVAFSGRNVPASQEGGEAPVLPMLAFILGIVANAGFYLALHWSLHLRVMADFRPASMPQDAEAVLVVPKPHRGAQSLVALQREASRASKEGARSSLTFTFQHRKYAFTKSGVRQLRPSVELPMHRYREAARYGGKGGAKAASRAMQDYGPNLLDVEVPSLRSLLVREALTPVSVLKLLDLLLVAVEGTAIGMLVMNALQFFAFRLRCAMTVRSNLCKLRQEMIRGRGDSMVSVYREGRWTDMSVQALVPGDVIALRGGGGGEGAKPASRGIEEVPADLLVLHGQAVVDEAILTGESLPQLKTAMPASPPPPPERKADGSSGGDGDGGGGWSSPKLDMEGRHRPHVLFSGTRLIRIDSITTTGKEGQAGQDDGDEEEGRQATGGMSSAGLPCPLPPISRNANQSSSSSSSSSGGLQDGPPVLVAYVLRTGYLSSQGELLRMIDFRGARVDADSPDTLRVFVCLTAISLLCAAWVLIQGLTNVAAGGPGGELHHHGGGGGGSSLLPSPPPLTAPPRPSSMLVLVRAVRLVSLGVPFYLLDMLSDTVSYGVHELATKAHILTTEPFRIPLAGRVDTCLFDKTGTLTTEHLTLRGIIPPPATTTSGSNASGGGGGGGGGGPQAMVPAESAPLHAQMVLGACHSLVDVEGRLAGDSLELSAVQALLRRSSWSFNSTTSTMQLPPSPSSAQRHGKKEGKAGSTTSSSGGGGDGCRLRVVRRYRFDSALQRMSVVARASTPTTSRPHGGRVAKDGDKGRGDGPHHHHHDDDEDHHYLCLVKGSPEALHPLLDPATVPTWYHAAYHRLAAKGARVLALAYRNTTHPPGASREEVEKAGSLTFAGLASFATRIRSDCEGAVGQLRQAGMAIAVVSGDSLLTSLHVASKVGIVKGNKVITLEAAAPTSTNHTNNTRDKDGGDQQQQLSWWLSEGAGRVGRKVADFKPHKVPALARKYDLATSGASLSMALGQGRGGVGRYLHHFRIFARMTPELKERVVRLMREEGGRVVLMCGDGANDVGALKQADAGVALLTGFGTANAKEEEGGDDEEEEDEDGDEIGKGRKSLSQTKKKKQPSSSAVPPRSRLLEPKGREEVKAAFNRTLVRELDQWTMVHGRPNTTMEAVRMLWSSYQGARRKVFHGDAAQSAAALTQGGEGEEEVRLKLGDASLAAPFTSKQPSVSCVLELIRQGRATLSRVQQQSRQGVLESLSSLVYYFTLAVFAIKRNNKMAVALGLLSSFLEMGMRETRPLAAISRVRLPSSIFHTSSILSIAGQTIITTIVTVIMLRTVGVQRKTATLHTTHSGGGGGGGGDDATMAGGALLGDDDDDDDDATSSSKRVGSILSLAHMVETVATCVTTVRGRPFSSGLSDSTLIIFGAIGLVAIPAVALLGLSPRMSASLGLSPRLGCQTMAQQVAVAACLTGLLLLPVALDRLLLKRFAPDMWRAMQQAREERSAAKDEDMALVGRWAKALGIWGLVVAGVVPWEQIIATLSYDPTEKRTTTTTTTTKKEGGGGGEAALAGLVMGGGQDGEEEEPLIVSVAEDEGEGGGAGGGGEWWGRGGDEEVEVVDLDDLGAE